MKDSIKKRVDSLRTEMKKSGLDAWYISGTDPHSSEYLPEHWETRNFISGFSGSYGVVVITQNEAALWTDTRYFLQATEELEGTGIKMMKLRVPDAVSPDVWLSQKLGAGDKVGIDAQTLSVRAFRALQSTLTKQGIELVETRDIFEAIWPNRPSLPNEQVFELEPKYTGRSRREKHAALVDELQKSDSDLHVVSMLDEIAWLYNLRGSDIPYNPVFTAFAIIGKHENILFVDARKINSALKIRLEADGVRV